MSEPVHAQVPVDADVPVYHEPDFDGKEVQQFGKDDGQAVGFIGKMLVSFFFYSLIVMLLVGYWTSRTFRFEADEEATAKPAATSSHGPSH